jgi:hypothetical protein
MKTITIDDKKIEISDESYEALKKQFVTKDKAILWKPEIGQTYWFADIDGDGKELEWTGDLYDEFRFSMGGIYRTEEEEDEAFKTGWIAKRKAEVEILRFIAENDLEWEWVTYESNYSIFYDSGAREFTFFSLANDRHSTPFHFRSKQDALKVIDAMTPQLKILFGVK